MKKTLIQLAASKLGKKGGQIGGKSRSKAKVEAARLNGLKHKAKK